MVLQLPPPGVEHAEEARQIAADVLGVLGQFLHGLRRSGEQGGITGTLVAAEKGSNLLRDSESSHEVIAGQLALELPLQPLSCFMVLALGTVAIAARAMQGVVFAALFALIDERTVLFRATVDDGVDHLCMLSGHGFTVTIEVLWAELAEDLVNYSHG